MLHKYAYTNSENLAQICATLKVPLMKYRFF